MCKEILMLMTDGQSEQPRETSSYDVMLDAYETYKRILSGKENRTAQENDAYLMINFMIDDAKALIVGK